MEIFLSAVLGELTTRAVNFFTRKGSRQTALDVEDRLRRVLLRAQVIVEEAMGRYITNHAMLRQLDMLRDTMHRGYYMLDTFRCHSQDEDSKDKVVSHSLSLSEVNFLKFVCSSRRNTEHLDYLQKALDDLSSMILDMNEFAMFLTSYPRLYYQPYSMHLLLGNCMFGRQIETELVINFLLDTQPRGFEELEVLPIVGPGKVGKSTLVAHICKDERVRYHFSEIFFLCDHDFPYDELATSREGCAMKHQYCLSNSNIEKRLLVVVELIGDPDDDAWNRLYSYFKPVVQSGSKIIVISRSNKIVKFGTTQTLTLKYLSTEAYWYFFKTLTFGSMDPLLYPSLMNLAMEIAKTLNSSFIGAHITALMLRDNFGIHFWCKVLAFLKGTFKKHISKFGGHPVDLMNENRPTHFWRMATPSEEFVVHHQYQRSSQEEVPKIKMQDLMYGSVKPRGKFEILGWKSHIPPYYSFVYTCEIPQLKYRGAKRKRSMKDGVTLC